MSSLTERKLLEGLKAGDVSALENCMDKYSLYLLAVSAKLDSEVLSREDREEIVSDSFLALWNNRDKLEKANIKSYLAAIVRNKTIDALRAYHVVLPLEDDILILACDDPEAETIKKELTELTKKAVESLPQPDRDIFKRHYFLYEKTGDIAESMGINPATVRTKLSRGRDKVKACLREKGYEYENTSF